jgi:hypothetical protein
MKKKPKKTPNYLYDYCYYNMSNQKDGNVYILTHKGQRRCFGDEKNPKNPKNPKLNSYNRYTYVDNKKLAV